MTASPDDYPNTLHNINEDMDNSNIPELDTNGFFCSQPFTNLEVNEWGDVRTCCAYWMNQSLGNINECSMDEVLNSDVAKSIRESILDGSFSFCNKRTCPRIQSGGDNILQKIEDVTDPELKDIIQNKRTEISSIRFVNFLWDLSCNLKCPSCRVGSILNTKGEDYQRSLDIQNTILNYVFDNQHGKDVIFNITGSGDPFGSKIFRDFLINFDGRQHPNIKINLQTNGVMFTEKIWNMMWKCHENIGTVLVSIDAATESTYDKIRVGGNWPILMKNIKMLDELHRCGEIEELRLDFVVQTQNYKEMPQAAELADSLYGVNNIYFAMVTDWGTWSREEYKKHAVWMEDNEHHKDFLETLKHPSLRSDKVILGNLSEFYRIANE